MMVPYMADREIELMDKIMDVYRPAIVLEWGIGWSTVRWSACPSVKKWVGVEHVKEWVDNMNKNVDTAKVKLIFAPVETENYKYASKESIQAYVGLHEIDGKYDMIFIDGDCRIQCFQRANELLVEKGICIAHDTARKYMHDYFHLFKHHKVLTEGEINVNKDWHQGLTILWNSDELNMEIEKIK